MILLLSDDLIDASKTTASARAAGIEVRQMRTIATLLMQAHDAKSTCCIVDLQFPGLELADLAVQLRTHNSRIRLIGYGSHVDHVRLKEARQAGFDEVMPRSEFFDTMPARIAEWAADESKAKSS